MLILSRPRTVIGRDPGRCHIVVDSEKYFGTLSRAHCAIVRHMPSPKGSSAASSVSSASSVPEWWMEDLHSTNGTFVNGIAMRSTSCRLMNGDVVTLGTNDRNAAELKDGEWWEVERWSDTVFRFECLEEVSRSSSPLALSAPSLPSSPLPSSRQSSRRQSMHTVLPLNVDQKIVSKIASKKQQRRHRPSEELGGREEEVREGGAVESIGGRASKRQRVGRLSSVSRLSVDSSQCMSSHHHAVPVTAGDETPHANGGETPHADGGAKFDAKEVHQLKSTRWLAKNKQLLHRRGMPSSSAFEGLTSKNIASSSTTSPSMKRSAAMSSSVAPARSRGSMSSSSSSSSSAAVLCREITSTPVSKIIIHDDNARMIPTATRTRWSGGSTPENHGPPKGWENETRSGLIPSPLSPLHSPPMMASPPPRTRATTAMMTTMTTKTKTTTVPTLPSPLKHETLLTATGGSVATGASSGASSGALSGPSSGPGSKDEFGEEYVPIGIDQFLTHPLEGTVLTVVSAESLPSLDPSCAMWGRQRRSRWEQRAHREGTNMFVRVQGQLGKGGSALVFRGRIMPGEEEQEEQEEQEEEEELFSLSSSSAGPVRRSSRITNMYGTQDISDSSSSEEDEDEDEQDDDDEQEDDDKDMSCCCSDEEENDNHVRDSSFLSSYSSGSKRVGTSSGGHHGQKSTHLQQREVQEQGKEQEQGGNTTDIALKVVTRSDASSVSAFWTELDALLSLQRKRDEDEREHDAVDKHVVRLVGVCFEADYVVAVITYHRGGPLSKWWKRHRKLNRGQKVGESAVAKVLYGVGRALDFCHESGRLHLDVKENNIVFDRGVGDVDRVVLIDFGCAVSVKDTNGMVIDTGYDDYFEGGTFCCMAPEVLSIAVRALRHERLDDRVPPPCFGAKADVWSLGIMAHVLLTGRYPYGLTGERSDDVEAHELLQRMLSSDKPWDGARDRQQLSSKAQNFLSRLLTIDVASRCTLSEAMMDPFIVEYNTAASSDGVL